MNIYQKLYLCQQSFPYFVRNYVKIKNYRKGEEAIPFDLYPYQEELIDLFNKEQGVATVKFRQSGISTLSVAYAVWKILFNQNEKIYIFGKTHREIRHLSDFIDIITENLPNWMPKIIKSKGTNFISATTESVLIFAGIDDLQRVHDATQVFIDEVAFVSNMEEKWTLYLKPSYKKGTKIFVSSTPNGTGNWFCDVCTKTNDIFRVYRPSYKDHPDYSNKEWAEETRNRLGEKGWRQEVLAEFIESSKPYCDFKLKHISNLNKIKKDLKLTGKETIDQIIKELENEKNNF